MANTIRGVVFLLATGGLGFLFHNLAESKWGTTAEYYVERRAAETVSGDVKRAVMVRPPPGRSEERRVGKECRL